MAAAQSMYEQSNELARLITLEEGKPLAEAAGEVKYAASFIEWFSEEAKRVYGDTVPSSSVDKRILVLKRPVGVTAAITPWNFPAAMITRKLGPALAAGCSMVIKPSELTPLTALEMARIFDDVGLPKGVLSVVVGQDAPALASVLMEDRRVRKVSFTGSTEVGKILMRNAADTMKRLSLELGGHAPFIVFEDADLDAAVEHCVASKMRNMGETCVAANRIFVQRGIYDEFAERLTGKLRQMRVGNGLDDGVMVGPLIDQATFAKVQSHVDDAVSKGARVALGGGRAGSNRRLLLRAHCPARRRRLDATRTREPSVRWPRSCRLTPNRKSSGAPMTPFTASHRIFSPGTSDVCGDSRGAAVRHSWGRTTACHRPPRLHSVASKSPASGAKAVSTAWTSIWTSSTSRSAESPAQPQIHSDSYPRRNATRAIKRSEK